MGMKMTQQSFIQDELAPNLSNYGTNLDAAAKHIFSALKEYFNADPFAQALGCIRQEEDKVIIDLYSLSTKLSILARTVIDDQLFPYKLISIQFKDGVDSSDLLLMKVSRYGKLTFSNDVLTFDENSNEFDYDDTYIPAQIISRTLEILMKSKIISI